jgi:nucleoside-diphosphate-sugar epimerase
MLETMKTAIVTGATSYLGIELVTRLIHENIKVHIIKRTKSDTIRLISRAPDVNIHTYNGKQSSLTNIFLNVRPDIVFHLASKYVREEEPEDIETLITSNITFGSQILAAAENSSVKSFINTGSYFQFSDKNKPPVNLYGVTKNSFIKILDYYSSLNKFSATSLIIFDTYGPGDWRKKLFPNIAKAIQNNSPLPTPENEILLYPVFYADVIDCYLLAAKKLTNKPKDIAGKSFAVRGKNPYKIDEIIALFEKASGKKVLIKHGKWQKPSREIKNIWRGKTLPDWRPKHSLLEGIQSMLKE